MTAVTDPIPAALARFFTVMDGPPRGSVRLIGGPLDGRKLVPNEVLGSLLEFHLFSVDGGRRVYYVVVDGSCPQVASFLREVPRR